MYDDTCLVMIAVLLLLIVLRVFFNVSAFDTLPSVDPRLTAMVAEESFPRIPMLCLRQ